MAANPSTEIAGFMKMRCTGSESKPGKATQQDELTRTEKSEDIFV
jgi:hypothetical protein